MFKIAIDCRSLTWPEGSGIRRYLINILSKILAEKNNSYLLLTNVPIDFASIQLTLQDNAKVILLPSNDFLYKFFFTPYFLYTHRADSYWSPTPDLPIWKPPGCKYYVTLHDIFFESKSNKYSLKIRALKSLNYFYYIAHLSDRIITDSKYVKKDIINRYKVDAHKVVVSYLAVDPNIYPIPIGLARTVVKEQFEIQKPYVFHIDCANTIPLLKAFSKLVSDDKPHILVLLGGITLQVEHFVSSYHLSDRVIFIRHHVSDYILSCLYSAATCLIATSADEGFGLAPLEALQCGSDIIVPDAGCFQEIYGDSAMYFEYNNEESLKDAIQISISGRTNRNKNVVLSKYSWERSSKGILSTLHSSSSSELGHYNR